MMKRLLAATALSLSVMAVASPVLAYPPTVPPSVNVSLSIVTPGGTVDVSVTGCAAGETVSVKLSTLSQTVTCGAGGVAVTTVIAPTAVGTYPVTAVAAPVAPRTATVRPQRFRPARLTVAPQTTPRRSNGAVRQSSLPATGTDSSTVLTLAGLTLVSGMGLGAVAYRRRR